MKIEHNNIDFGLYIDHKRSFIIELNHGIHEELLEEITEVKDGYVEGSREANQQLHIQNKKNEQLKKFCKAIISKIDRASRILIFGPGEQKFELQKEIKSNKSLVNVGEELLTSDFMDKDEAIRFATKYFQHKV